MTDMQRKMMEFAGLSEKDFQPQPRPEQRLDNVEQRTDALEAMSDDIILMMADLIGGKE